MWTLSFKCDMYLYTVQQVSVLTTDNVAKHQDQKSMIGHM